MTARFGGLLLSAVLWCGPVVVLADDPTPDEFGGPPLTQPGDAAASDSKAKPKLTKEEIARNRALEKVNKQLRVLRPVRGQPGPNDFFLVGKVEIGADKEAKVEFGLLQGTKPASEEILSYLTGASATAARSWRPFARYGDQESAEKGLVAIREEFDQLQTARAEAARQSQLAAQYAQLKRQSRSICRT
jgi:hypothetical protein